MCMYRFQMQLCKSKILKASVCQSRIGHMPRILHTRSDKPHLRQPASVLLGRRVLGTGLLTALRCWHAAKPQLRRDQGRGQWRVPPHCGASPGGEARADDGAEPPMSGGPSRMARQRPHR